MRALKDQLDEAQGQLGYAARGIHLLCRLALSRRSALQHAALLHLSE